MLQNIFRTPETQAYLEQRRLRWAALSTSLHYVALERDKVCKRPKQTWKASPKSPLIHNDDDEVAESKQRRADEEEAEIQNTIKKCFVITAKLNAETGSLIIVAHDPHVHNNCPARGVITVVTELKHRTTTTPTCLVFVIQFNQAHSIVPRLNGTSNQFHFCPWRKYLWRGLWRS